MSKPKKTWWKVYAWLGLLGVVKSLFALPRMHSLLTILLFLLGVVETIGLFGYAYHKKIGKRNIWQVVFPLAVIHIAVVVLYVAPHQIQIYSLLIRILVSLIIFVVSLPLLIALYKYPYSKN